MKEVSVDEYLEWCENWGGHDKYGSFPAPQRETLEGLVSEGYKLALVQDGDLEYPQVISEHSWVEE